MSKSTIAKLENALKDLVEAYINLESELEEAHEEDDDAYAAAMIEALEGAIEVAIDEFDASTQSIASMVTAMTEALEQLDPSAFDDDEEDSQGFELDDVEEVDYDDLDEDEDLDLDE